MQIISFIVIKPNTKKPKNDRFYQSICECFIPVCGALSRKRLRPLYGSGPSSDVLQKQTFKIGSNLWKLTVHLLRVFLDATIRDGYCRKASMKQMIPNDSTSI
jgi:hypothetical protein